MIPKTGIIITSFLLLFIQSTLTNAQDFIEDLVDPRDRMERSPETPIGYDFKNVIFDREYFYSITEGTIQFRNSNSGPWKSLDLKLGVSKPGDQTLKEVPAEGSWQNEVAPGVVDAPAGNEEVRRQITKPEAEHAAEKRRKTREEILRELERTVGVPR